MTMQNVAYKNHADYYHNKYPNIYYEEIDGIKLRDSLFIVYSPDSSYTGSEFIYIFKPIESTREMIFDNYNDSDLNSGGHENCGIYRLEDQRILEITEMHNWHYKGHIFKNEEVWKQY